MAHNPIVELWTLYAVAVCFTILRTYARIKAVGFRELHPDDYLIWFAILIYTTQCTLGYNVGAAAHGLANNGMTDAERSALSPDSPEYQWRIIGSKIQVAGWTTAAFLLWTLKICMTFFYLRLTKGLGSRYLMRIYVGMGLIAGTFIAVIFTIFLSCRPFSRYWQINPDPGNACQAAISKPILWVKFILNVSTDIYLLLIPIPMLWRSSLRLLKKIATTMVLSAGVAIIVFATLKSIYVIVDPIHGGQVAASWGTRETFAAVITTNLPMIFPLLKSWIMPLLPSHIRSSSNQKNYKTPDGFVTIGGGGGSRSRQGPHSAHHITANMTFDNESEERIIKGDGVIKLQDVHANAIVVSNEVRVTAEDRSSERTTTTF
ncbi:uncharacterized protein EI97DRAFT_323914 [Westerdykella ornata]|uniref:Rhodopsin domain-containing protein n=1 Tax=Westerdykella ornata TaxID=318751 RepID=A0A6A6JLN4_WESOR|nr:uncharacterized protein EI97DRAFT_323914 [Westerdykella ornata]KAF2276858.1 hypothetical protein EI97DRAFT_323914 [Westerdykella ornata]